MPPERGKSRSATAPAVGSLGYPIQLLEPGQTFESVTEKVGSIALGKRHPRSWWLVFGCGALLSLVLVYSIVLLFLQRWRNSINRLAEAMTIFAVACAGLFPILHLGRPEVFYWLIPYPNVMR